MLHQDKVNNLRPIERETRSLGKKFDIYNTYCTERWTLYAALSQTRSEVVKLELMSNTHDQRNGLLMTRKTFVLVIGSFFYSVVINELKFSRRSNSLVKNKSCIALVILRTTRASEK